MSQRLHDLFTVLNAIKRIVEETHESIEAAIADVAGERAVVDEARADCADRWLAMMSMIRPAGGQPDSAELLFAKTTLATSHGCTRPATCSSASARRSARRFENIQRALANVELVPRTENLGGPPDLAGSRRRTQHLSRIES